MLVTELALQDFRSYPGVQVVFEPGPNTLIGPNGQGKTNLVEAIAYLATLSSHRVSSDAALVRQGCDFAQVRAVFIKSNRQMAIDLTLQPGRASKARVNKNPCPRVRDILGIARVIVFAPEDLALVKGDPGERRRMLDELMVQFTPRLAGLRSEYERIVRQRTALLKTAILARRSGGGDLSTLDVWDDHLAEAGAEIMAARQGLIAALGPLADAAYADIAPTHAELSLRYVTSLEAAGLTGPPPDLDRAELKALLLEAIGQVRAKEIERGVTLIGPHRDDLALSLGTLPVKGYASHGESWSTALALRLASFELFAHRDGADGQPILILDDVFAELDTARRSRLAERIAGAQQVIVTAAVPDDVPGVLVGQRFDVGEGRVSRA